MVAQKNSVTDIRIVITLKLQWQSKSHNIDIEMALKEFGKSNSQGLLYTGRARASLGLSSLGQFFRQCLSPHFLLWNLDFWYAWSLGQNEKNWKNHFSKNWKLTFSGPSIDFWLFFSSLSLYWPQATPLDLQP